jgi:hypothetical protein
MSDISSVNDFVVSIAFRNRQGLCFSSEESPDIFLLGVISRTSYAPLLAYLTGQSWC